MKGRRKMHRDFVATLEGVVIGKPFNISISDGDCGSVLSVPDLVIGQGEDEKLFLHFNRLKQSIGIEGNEFVLESRGCLWVIILKQDERKLEIFREVKHRIG